MIDLHCHLDLYPNPHEVIRQCRDLGIYVLSVTTTPQAWHGNTRIVEGCNRIRTALGLHPQLAHERYSELDLFDELLPLAIRYVGEIGLEGSRDWKPFADIQITVFRHILQSVTKAGGRILSIHSRAAVDAVLDHLAEYPQVGIPVLHWFSGNKTQLTKAIDMGCWFSVNPAMLRSKKGALLVQQVPLDRILTETDGPFAKHNKNSLMPWDVKIAESQLSQLWQIPEEEVVNRLHSNFKNLLNLIEK